MENNILSDMTYTENSCRFIQSAFAPGEINILHFVLEPEKQSPEHKITFSNYRMHLVVKGSGVLKTQYSAYSLSEGDLFFTFPASAYTLETIDDFKYLYIGFVGTRANAILEKFGIRIRNCVFKDFIELKEIWENCLKLPISVLDMGTEGIFLFSLSKIGERIMPVAKKGGCNTPAIIKKYVDENYADSKLNLNSLSKTLNYNSNYISYVFKKEFGVSFREYLNLLRINNACALIEKGFTSVKDISYLCGFDDPLYFSKVFKKRVGSMPSSYIRRKSNAAYDIRPEN